MANPAMLPATTPSAIFDPRDARKLDCTCFKRVQILAQPLGGHLAAWELQTGFRGKGAFHFYVDFGRPGTNEWECLNTVPIVDSCLFMDPLQRHWDHLADWYYRVRLALPEDVDPATGQCRLYASQPQQANGILNKKDWLLAREICRKEYLYQRKRVNMTAVGWLLKRKRWGTGCPQCLDYDSGEVKSVDCPVCYGTGFVGGYFPAVDFIFTLVNAPWPREFKWDETVSRKNDIARQGRAVAYPYLDTNDVYVRQDTGERFFVNQIQTAAEVGGVPVVVLAELRLAPVTHVIYKIPLAAPSSSSSSKSGPSSSPSSSSVPPCDWRVGLNGDEENW